MDKLKMRDWCLAALAAASVLCVWNEAAAQPENGFPKPYIMENSGMGAEDAEITLNKMAALPDWFSIAVQHRIRYETLSGAFRANTSGSDQLLALRTLAQAELRLNDRFMFKAELQDARAELADAGTYINTTTVNAAELLEANIQWNEKNLFMDGSKSVLRAGRITMDFGHRRLVARQRFRNTVDAYTGLDGIWKSKGGAEARAFYTLPVDRLPSQREDLVRNGAALDQERLHRRFLGLAFSTPNLPWGDSGEIYFFNLKEEDRPGFQTANRNLHTPGMRLYRPDKRGRFDYEWESILQFGTSRASAASDTQDLAHFAHFHHVEAGYTLMAPWAPRFLLEYDYASGDAHPQDGKNGAFDTLFGPAIEEFGPLSIYTPFVRSNINSPGVRFLVRPDKTLKANISYRAFFLASATDAWGGSSGLRDTAGRSGTFLGHQWVLRVKWQATPNLFLEGSTSYRLDGDFQNNVPRSPQAGSTLYSFVSAIISF